MSQRLVSGLGFVGGRRSGWAVLAVGALVASLLVVGSPSAGAAEIRAGNDNTASPDVLPDFSACVGDAMRDAGFEDTAGLGAEDAINCLAYYGITRGKTAERFDAGSEVTRSQMALFLYRAADVAGLDLTRGAGFADFDDIDGLDEERQGAIRALARNGILSGSGTRFNPGVSITRAQMAVALVAFLRHASPNLFYRSGTLRGRLILASGETLDHFADARRSVPRGVDTAISYAYELGITRGSAAGPNVFSPGGPVLRKNMASFITRMLAHTNVRPAGLTAQSVSGTVTASIRDAGFDPVGNEIVDGFYIATASEDRAFGSLGECRPAVKAVDGGSGGCAIGVVDPATNADGNVAIGTLSTAAIGKGATVWVWTGDVGDRFDVDRVDSYKLLLKPGAAAAATKMVVSPDMPAHARFGAEVVFTAQLQHTSDGVDRDTSVGSDGRRPARYKLQRKVFSRTSADEADPTASSKIVSVSEEEFFWTDAQGRITFGLTTTDPDPSAGSNDDYRTVQYVLTGVKNAPSQTLSKMVVFSDAPSRVATVRAVPARKFVVVPAAGASASNAVTATALDQYGTPVRNVAFTVTSSTDRSEMPSRRHTTASSGSVRIPYTHRGGPAVTETLTVTHTPASGTAVSGTAKVYWVERTEEPKQDSGLNVIGGDTGAGTVVVDKNAKPTQVSYDGNDVFKLNGEFVTRAAFEAELAKILDPNRKVTGTLTWSSYDHDDDTDIALFELTTTGGTTTTTTTAPSATTTSTTTSTTTAPASTTTAPATTTTAPASTTTLPLGQAAAESVSVTAVDAAVRASKMTDGQQTTYYSMKFGDFSYFDVQLLYTDESDGNKVKRAAFGKDGTNPVTLQVIQRNTAGAITSITGVRRLGPSVDDSLWNPLSTGVIVRCGNANCPTFTPSVGPELITDENGAARFTVTAPADPNPGTAGDVTTLLVRVHEEVNGPRSNTNPTTNHGLHYFYVKVTDGARTTSGTPTTTTVPSGNAATKFTVKSVGARTDKTFPIATGAGNAASGTTYVDADFGAMVNIVVQLTDSSDADTTAGADGSGPASFQVHHILVYNYLVQLSRRGANVALFWSDPAGATTQSFGTIQVTNRKGYITYPAWHADPEPDGEGNKASLGLAIRADTNAPGATGNDGTTRIAFAIVRYYEPAPTTTTTTTTTVPGATTTTTLPDKPAKPTSFSAAAGNGSVTLEWADPGDDSITGYEFIQREKNGTWGDWGSWTAIGGSDADTTTYTVSGLTNGKGYRFRIRAVNGAGNGAQSAWKQAKPAAGA